MKNFNTEIIETYNNRLKKRDIYLPTISSNLIAKQQLAFHLALAISNFYNRYDFSNLKLIDFGSGNGSKTNLFISLGFKPSNLTCIEINPNLVREAIEYLPEKVTIKNLPISEYVTKSDGGFDIAFQSMALSSINNLKTLKDSCDSIACSLKVNGLFISYDFIIKNPRNKEVIPISAKFLKQYFPQFDLINYVPLTLAPPIARKLDLIIPRLIPALSALRLLNTHRLIILKKK